MSRHASMNRIYRLIWNEVRSAWVPVAETARGRGKSGRAKSVSTYGVVAGVTLALAPLAHASGAPPPCVAPVSYTHLDVYKRQPVGWLLALTAPTPHAGATHGGGAPEAWARGANASETLATTP